jgi:UDP-N-acetylmuramate: L-alanyl-gamma-D-glutamyl-meso-diaminopimelate ligase
MPPPSHGAQGHDQLDQADILARIAGAGVSVVAVAGGAEAISRLDGQLGGDEVILLLSSGPLDGLAETLPPRLDARFAG